MSKSSTKTLAERLIDLDANHEKKVVKPRHYVRTDNEEKSYKGKNTFKFQSFAERIANLDIRKKALYLIEHKNEEKEEESCYFHDAYQKWRVLNLTEDYAALAKDLQGIFSLAQLVHKRDFIVEQLLKAYETFTVISIQPLLELTSALARDLTDDFYEYFGKVFKALTKLLEAKDGEQVEWTFTCIAHIFKALKRSLKKNFSDVFALILPELSNQKPPEIVSFIAECFAFITRDLARKEDFYPFILRTMTDEHIFGVGRLIYEIIRGIGGNLHMDAKIVLTETFKLFLKEKVDEKLFDIHVQIITDVAENIKESELVAEILQATLKKSFKGSSDSVTQQLSKNSEDTTQQLLKLIGQLVESSRNNLQKILPILLDCTFASFEQNIGDDTLLILSRLVVVLLRCRKLQIAPTEINRLCKTCLSIRKVSIVAEFVMSMKDYVDFDIFILPDLVRYAAAVGSVEVLEIFGNLFLDRGYMWTSGSDVCDGLKLPSNEKLTKYLSMNSESVAIFCYPYLVPVVKSADLENLRKATTLKLPISNEEIFRLLIVVQTRAKCGDSDFMDLLPIMLQLLPYAVDANHLVALRFFDVACTVLKTIKETFKTEVKNGLSALLSVHHGEQRQLTAHILSILESAEKENVYHVMYKIESTAIDAFNYREHIMWLDKMRPGSSALKPDWNLDIIRFLFGTLFRNFKLIWEPVINMLTAYSDEVEAATFWAIFKNRLDFATKNSSKVELDEVNFNSEIVSKMYARLSSLKEEADTENYRILLWTCLAKIPTICDQKNRDIVGLYLTFYHEEFLPRNKSPLDETVIEELEGTDENETANEKLSNKNAIKILKEHLNVFLSMKNPTQIYKCADVAHTFKELLLHRTSEIQSLGLKCLLHCKCTYFKSMATELTDLVQELKGTLSEFDIDKLKAQEHRQELVDTVMRIAFAKLVSKPSKSDRISYVARKQRVIQFLKRFTPEDIRIFFDISFHQVLSRETLPLKIAVGTAQLCRLLSDELTEYIDGEGITFLINVLLKLGRQIDEKQIRVVAYSALASLFERYPKYDWKPEEVDAIFDLYITPQIATLTSDCITSVSAQLKVILEWGKNNKYFNLLTRPLDTESSTPLNHVINILVNPKTTKEVKIVLFDFVNRLIVAESEGMEVLATNLLVPYLATIIQCVKQDLKNDNLNIDTCNLIALMKVAKSQVMAEDLEEFVAVLIQVIAKADSNLKKPLELLKDCAKNVENPEQHLRKIAPFFQKITDLDERKLICSVAINLNRNDGEFVTIIKQLNAFNERWRDQPDYNQRLSAFNAVEEYFAHCNLSFVMILFYQCYFYLENDKDIAMRGKAGVFLSRTMEIYLKRFTDDESFLDKNVLSLISTTLKSLKNPARSNALKLLGELTRNSTTHCGVLMELKQICNSQDLTQDFFVSVTDIQHKIQKNGLQRLAKALQGMAFSQRTLVHFILPIVTFYTCNNMYAEDSAFIEVVMTAFSNIPEHLTWNNYEQLLRKYLEKLSKDFKYQKQLITMCVKILNGFHFKEDCKEIDDPAEFLKSLETGENQANRVIKTIMKFTVPTLMRQINSTVTLTSGPKSKQERDERYKQDRQNVTKLALAYALIKLLQKLPKCVLNYYLQNIIYSVANFLKSSSDAVRIMSRDMLRKILIALGPSYLEDILLHCSSTLDKGNEIHILTVTTNTLIEAVRSTLKAEHMDAILQIVIRVCVNDIFRQNSGYKKELRLMNRRDDAKPNKKSFVTLNILAEGISESCMLDLVLPIKEVLVKTHLRVELLKVKECFDNIVAGLVKNEAITKESLLVFIHGILSESIPQLVIKPFQAAGLERPKLQQNDTFIISKEPKRKGAMTHSSTVKWKSDTNKYMLTEFSFHILHILLKRKIVLSVTHRPCLDALVPLITKALYMEEVRIQIFALKCVACIWTCQLKLEQMRIHEPEIVKRIFEIIQKFVQNFIARKEENLLLIRNSFKALVCFFRNVSQCKVQPKQTQLLLEYVENEMKNPDTKSMAFPLLRAIIEKKLYSKMIGQVMKKVASMSVYSEAEWVRKESKVIILKYLTNYPSKINQTAFLTLYCKALSHKYDSTKIAAANMITILMNDPLDKEVFDNHWQTLASTLFDQMVSERSEAVQEHLGETTDRFFNKLNKEQLEKLFETTKENFESIYPHQKRYAVKFCSCLVRMKKDLFLSKLDMILPNLVLCLVARPITTKTPGKFVRCDNAAADDDTEDDETRRPHNQKHKKRKISDIALNLQVLETLNAIEVMLNCIPAALQENNEYFEQFVSAAIHLAEHDSIQISAKSIELLEKVVTICGEDKVKVALRDNCSTDVPFGSPRDDLKQLIVNLLNKLSQLADFEWELIEKILNVIVKFVPLINEVPPDFDDEESLNTLWICRGVRKILNDSVDEDSINLEMKKHIYNWINNMIVVLDPGRLVKVAQTILSPPIKDLIENNDQFKEQTTQIWTNLQNKFLNAPSQWAKIQNIYNSLKMGIDKRANKLETRKRKASEMRYKAKRRKSERGDIHLNN